MAYNWKGADVWRAHPLLSGNMKFALPGFGYGLAAFAVYVAYDQFLGASSKPKAEHHH